MYGGACMRAFIFFLQDWKLSHYDIRGTMFRKARAPFSTPRTQ